MAVTRDIRTFISEKHQMSFYYWCLARKELGLSIPLFVVILDRHSDMLPLPLEERERVRFLNIDDLQQVKDFVAIVLDDRNFYFCDGMWIGW